MGDRGQVIGTGNCVLWTSASLLAFGLWSWFFLIIHSVYFHHSNLTSRQSVCVFPVQRGSLWQLKYDEDILLCKPAHAPQLYWLVLILPPVEADLLNHIILGLEIVLLNYNIQQLLPLLVAKLLNPDNFLFHLPYAPIPYLLYTIP